VLDDHKRHAAIGPHMPQELLQRLEPACGGADADDGERRSRQWRSGAQARLSGSCVPVGGRGFPKHERDRLRCRRNMPGKVEGGEVIGPRRYWLTLSVVKSARTSTVRPGAKALAVFATVLCCASCVIARATQQVAAAPAAPPVGLHPMSAPRSRGYLLRIGKRRRRDSLVVTCDRNLEPQVTPFPPIRNNRRHNHEDCTDIHHAQRIAP
jgi:hypothetical protein